MKTEYQNIYEEVHKKHILEFICNKCGCRITMNQCIVVMENNEAVFNHQNCGGTIRVIW